MSQAAVRQSEIAAPEALDTLDAMAHLASATGSVVHVVSPRLAGIADRARLLAIQADLDVDVDFMPATVRVRFSPRA
jgi:hypothetical protein